MAFFRRPFSSRPAAAAFLYLLAAVTFHALPFAPQPVPLTFSAAVGGDERFIEPFPICGDSSGPDGFQADCFWLPDMPDLVAFGLGDGHVFPEPGCLLAEGFTASIFRPPRLFLLQSLKVRSG